MPIASLAIGAAILAALVDWTVVWRGGPRGLAVERIAKPLVPALLAVAVLAWPEGSFPVPGVRPWVIAALAASFAGDVLLLPPGHLVGGLVAFLVAHVGYLVAFAQLPGSATWLVIGLVAAVGVVVTIGLALVRASRGAGLAAPVGAYLLVICAMAVAATRTGLPAAIAGAWLFVASDAVLGWGTFHGGGETRGSRVAVIVTYHVAQVLIVLALLI